MRTESITSAQNAKIKTLIELQEKSKVRRKEDSLSLRGAGNLSIASNPDMQYTPCLSARKFLEKRQASQCAES
jgi:hypothetical protein